MIGGGAAGASAAAKARRHDEEADIVLLNEGRDISYGACGIPYWISGVIPSIGALMVFSPRRFGARYNVSVRNFTRVREIKAEQKKVIVEHVREHEVYQLSYDSLIICTGARPVLPDVFRVEGPIFALRNLVDAEKLKSFLKEYTPQSALVVGAGLIGLEMTENLQKIGVKVTLLEATDQVLPSLDLEMASIVHAALKRSGTAVLTGQAARVVEVKAPDRVVVTTSKGETIETNLIVVSVGVEPNSELCESAGLKYGPRRTIFTERDMSTGVEGIWAAGDCTHSWSAVTGQPLWLPLGSVANKQGRTAGANAVGQALKLSPMVGSTIAKVMDLTVAKVGLSQKEAESAGMKVICSYTHPFDRAHYYPGAEMLSVKLIAEESTGAIVGAQIIGREGVDKRADVFAMAIYNRMTCDELGNVDLHYAPPFAPAKDVCNVAAYVADDIRRGLERVVAPQEVDQDFVSRSDQVLIDVRTPEEYQMGHIPGAINVPLDVLREQSDSLDRRKRIVLYCKTGLRSYLALRILANKGFEDVWHIGGGYVSWEESFGG